jgi:tryptophan synthase alpha chain
MSKLMCHVVAGYPVAKTCLELMKGMASAGAEALEVQIPFSDPIADGETIMRANDAALANGMTVKDSFKLIKEADPKCDVYVMSYLQKVRHYGIEKFCEAAAKSGAKGLIIPDLPYDSPEYDQLQGKAKLIPVLSPGMPEARLKKLLDGKPELVYVTSQRGITGNEYSGGEELKKFVANIKERSDAKVMIGFGISTAQDVKDALSIGDTAVVGSGIIKKLQASGVAETLKYVGELAGAAR